MIDDQHIFVEAPDANQESLPECDGVKGGFKFSKAYQSKLKSIIEALIFAADKPQTLENIQSMLAHDLAPSRMSIKEAIQSLMTDYQTRGIQLVEHGGAYRFQTPANYSEWVQRLWEERPHKYSRALLETLALIAYRQPITRGDIEEVRGVAVSSTIMKTLQERSWVRIVGHREVPGRPAIYATTKQFLAHFNLKTLEDLPTLAEIRDIDQISREVNAQLALGEEFKLNPNTLDSAVLNELDS